MYSLTTESLNVYFGTKQVLKNVSIQIPQRQVTALIGPSGCGKSTLLRCFNRMHDLNHEARVEGIIRLNDSDIYAKQSSVLALRRQVGMVFQKPNPLPKSIFENVAYALRLHQTPKNEISARIEQSLRDSYLWDEVKDDLKKPATKLSGGQQQRLCIARTIALRPQVLLMDEPCSALDPISTHKIEELITRLKQDYTIIIVTHNMQQAQRIADYTAFMYLGELIEIDTTTKIFNQAREPLTQRYISGHFG